MRENVYKTIMVLFTEHFHDKGFRYFYNQITSSFLLCQTFILFILYLPNIIHTLWYIVAFFNYAMIENIYLQYHTTFLYIIIIAFWSLFYEASQIELMLTIMFITLSTYFNSHNIIFFTKRQYVYEIH